jgi:hypothetical protein
LPLCAAALTVQFSTSQRCPQCVQRQRWLSLTRCSMPSAATSSSFSNTWRLRRQEQLRGRASAQARKALCRLRRQTAGAMRLQLPTMLRPSWTGLNATSGAPMDPQRLAAVAAAPATGASVGLLRLAQQLLRRHMSWNSPARAPLGPTAAGRSTAAAATAGATASSCHGGSMLPGKAGAALAAAGPAGRASQRAQSMKTTLSLPARQAAQLRHDLTGAES